MRSVVTNKNTNYRRGDIMVKHFKTDNVIVRRFEMKDVEQAYLNLSVTDDFDDSTTDNDYEEHKSLEETRVIVKSAINEYYTDEPIWAVEDKVHKNLVGFIRVCNYSKKNKMCNITWAMSYKYWEDCFMIDALKQIFNFLFTKKDMELIECSYYEQNKETDVILEGIGMRREATLRDRRVNEKTHKKENFIIYSINKEEFYENNYSDFNNKKFKILHKKAL